VTTYALRRILTIIPTLLLVATVAFVLVRLVPGGPFDQERAVPVEVERALRAKYHLDDPVLTQYGDWLWALVSRGDLGPFRVKIRSASFNNISITPWLLRGVYVPDIITILASLYFILGDIDR